MATQRQNDRRHLISPDELATWPRPEVLAMSEAERNEYERKVDAITQYASGVDLPAIEKSTGIRRQYVYYLVRRCLSPDARGQAFGFLALRKGIHLVQQRRNVTTKLAAGRPLPGSLQALFFVHPDLEKVMYDAIVFGRDPRTPKRRARLSWAMIMDIFETECEKAGIRPPSYPFCRSEGGVAGEKALRRWGKKMKDEHQRKVVVALPRREIYASETTITSCFQRVEGDGHHIDINWLIEAPALNGEGVIRYRVTRLWLVAMLECRSSCVLGYSIGFGTNYGTSEVAKAIQNALVPWKPRSLHVSTIAYKEGECLPSALDPQLAFVCWDEMWLDGAKCHLSELFLSVVERTVGAVTVIGRRHRPNDRPRIENLFGLFEEAGIHPIDGTTGSHPKDPKRDKSKSDRYLLSLDVLLDLVDLLVVRYNTGVRPGTSLSRLEVLRRAIHRQPGIYRRMPEADRMRYMKYDLWEVARVGVEQGRPVLRWRGARYNGAGLRGQTWLVGQEVLVMADSSDLRVVEVTLLADGSAIGELDVEPRWRSTAHTLWTRNQVRREPSLLRHTADIPRALRAHTEQEARKRSATRKRQLAKVIYEQQSRPNPEDATPLDSVRDLEEMAADVGRHGAVETALDDDDAINQLIRGLGSVYR